MKNLVENHRLLCALVTLVILTLAGFSDEIKAKKSTNNNIFDDRYKTVEEICRQYGFGYEEHQLKTKDGYIL
jgi:hypothetical protein